MHGFGATGAFWRKWTPALAPAHQCYLIDLPGFGKSAPNADPSPSGLADSLLRFLDAEAIERPVLIGHSLGGGIALLAALALAERGDRDRLAGLVLVSAAVYPQRIPPYISLARTPGIGEIFLIAPPPLRAVRRGLQRIVGDPATVDDDQVRIQRAPYLSRERRRSLLRAARAIDPLAGEQTSSRLPGLTVPSLLIWGEEDPVVPLKYGVRLARELPGARLVRLPGVGHLPPEESPGESLSALFEFLRELPSPEEGA